MLTLTFRTVFCGLMVGLLGSAKGVEPKDNIGTTSLGEDRPNIIFVLADDLGWTDIQTGAAGPNVLENVNYGSMYYQTPNIARLAKSGLSFTHCFAHPNCAPTRAAILTGQYAPRSGNGVYHVQSLSRAHASEKPTRFVAPQQRTDIPPGHTIIAEALQRSGYVTAHFGKYHVGNHDGGQQTLPENQGFSFNYGGNSHGGPGNYHARNEQFGKNIGPQLDRFAKNYSSTDIDVLRRFSVASDPSSLLDSAKHVEDALGDAVLHFLNQHRTGAEANRPFYVQLHHYAVHSPTGNVHCRSDLLKKYQNRETDSQHAKASYAGILENMDQTLGRILEYLDDPNGDGNSDDSIANETLLVFTSDNGGISPTDNAPLRHVKGSFYNGGLRVPLIVRWPGHIPAGRQSDTLVHSVDFYPTLIEASKQNLPDEIRLDGLSFLKHAFSPDSSVRDRAPIFYHFPGYLDRRARPCDVTIDRIDEQDFKLIYNYDRTYTGNPRTPEYRTEGLQKLEQPWELYLYSEDLSEAQNLLAEDSPNRGKFLKQALQMALAHHDWLNQDTSDWAPAQLRDRQTDQIVRYPNRAEIRDTFAPQRSQDESDPLDQR